MRNRSYGFEIYLENVKTIRMIAQICVAFSEKLNFNKNYIEILDDSVSDCLTPARVFLVSNYLEENP